MDTAHNFVRMGALVAALLMANNRGLAGAFTLNEQNAAGIGSAFSETALASSPATVFYNPAGMTYLGGSFATSSVNVICMHGGFENQGSQYQSGASIGGGNGGNPGKPTPVPSFFYTRPLGAKAAWGVGVFAPFGLATTWDSNWVGRYHGIASELKTLNLNPSFAYRVNKQLSLGAGCSLQWSEATLKNAIDFGLIGYANAIPSFFPGSHDAVARVRGDDLSGGWNLGLMWDVSPQTRIGVAYRSKIANRLEGNVQFSNVPAAFAPIFHDQGTSVAFDLPETLSIHFAHFINERWSITGDFTRTSWSIVKNIEVKFKDPSTPMNSIPQNWRDSVMVGCGLQYRKGNTTWKIGGAYDQSPVYKAHLRLPLIPDSDKVWATVGFERRVSDRLRLSAGYAHFFMKSGATSFVDAQTHVLRGHFNLAVEILAVEASWGF
ncbi:MAG: outer membrane protein transport protein [Opitutae bacterium]|nr:outer membrane protein transport protein [Opitutae bacterium]